MLKLSMKKLGTPDTEPPSVDGKGGVSADGGSGLAFAFVPAPDFVWVRADGLLGWPRVTTVGGWDCCARTSGAGTIVVSVVVVVLVVVLGRVAVPDGAGSGAGGVGTVGDEGAVVVSGAGVGVSGSGTVVVVSASAPSVEISATSTTRIRSVIFSGRRIIMINQLPSK